MAIILASGETLRDVIEWHDKRCVKRNRSNEPDLLVMKSAIRYLSKDGKTKTETAPGPAQLSRHTRSVFNYRSGQDGLNE